MCLFHYWYYHQTTFLLAESIAIAATVELVVVLEELFILMPKDSQELTDNFYGNIGYISPITHSSSPLYIYNSTISFSSINFISIFRYNRNLNMSASEILLNLFSIPAKLD